MISNSVLGEVMALVDEAKGFLLEAIIEQESKLAAIHATSAALAAREVFEKLGKALQEEISDG